MTIALDIDGTITGRDHLIPEEVAAYFETLHKEGWQFLFVTGRIYSFAMMALSKLNFPFLHALQNGADLLEMPQNKQVARAYVNLETVQLLETLYQERGNDLVVYAGYEKGDLCYFRPERFSKEMLTYLKEVEKLSAKPWQAVEAFSIKDCGQSAFPLIKCVGSQEMLEALDLKLQQVKSIKTTIIRDPISRHFYITLITHEDANKGTAVKTFMEKYSLKRPLITGGDDNNDIPLLKEGDIRIAMDGAPEGLQKLAHIIAPPADQKGIIEGLRKALKGLE